MRRTDRASLSVMARFLMSLGSVVRAETEELREKFKDLLLRPIAAWEFRAGGKGGRFGHAYIV